MRKIQWNKTTMWSLFIATASAIALVMTPLSCNQDSDKSSKEVTSEDVKEELDEAADTMRAYLLEEKQVMVDSYDQRLEQLEEQIETFKGKMTSASNSVKETYQSRINRLESQYEDLESSVDEFKSSTEDAWEELRDGLEDAFADLEDSIEDASEEFNEES